MADFTKAAIKWTSTGDTNTERVFLLDAPLRSAVPSHTRSVFTAESLDKANIETFTAGAGAHEYTAQIRYASDPDGLNEMIKAGTENITLRYVPNLNDPDTQDQVKLVAPRGGIRLDKDSGHLGDQTVTVRFRKTDEKSFGPRFRGTNVLFTYRAGGSMSDATFSRDTNSTAPATYATLTTGDGGYGTLSTAKDEKARIQWMSSVSSEGPRNFPVLLLEKARTNYVPYSKCSTRTTEWTLQSGLAITGGQVDPFGVSTAVKITDNSTANEFLESSTANNNVATTGSTRAVLSFFVKWDADTTASRHQLAEATGSVEVIDIELAWSSGAISTYVMDDGIWLAMEQYRDGWYRVAARTVGNLSTKPHSIRHYPANNAGGVGSTGSIMVFGSQVETL